MKRRISQIVFSAMTLITALAGSTPASADHYRQMNRFARRIDNTAEAIARESRHFAHSIHYSCLVSETQQLSQLACHIRNVARAGCDLQHLRIDVINLGNAYRNLDAKLCLIERAEPGCYRTRRMRRLLDSVKQDIHRLVTSLSCLLNCTPESIRSYDFYGPTPLAPAMEYQYQNFEPGYEAAPAHVPGMGMPTHRGMIGNESRYPTLSTLQRQALNRSAVLESQLRAMRSGQGTTLSLGGGRLSLNF